jgi:hypothetical protein
MKMVIDGIGETDMYTNYPEVVGRGSRDTENPSIPLSREKSAQSTMVDQDSAARI